MGKAITYSESEVTALLAEVMDKEKVLLHCEPHRYLGSSTPPTSRGCKYCWEAYYWYMLASTPPHLREERLELLERGVAHAVELVEQGKFDFEPLARPEIHTEHTDD